ncbi:MAG: hypothetical protein SPI27_05885 [Bacteroidaceae bacterium]|nr:hypothetical protein [Bacteroidaceae bacterium]
MTDLLEKRLKEQVGKENPFRVPEGYFSTLPDRVCVRIARKQRERRMWRWAAAAVMAGCVATTSLLLVRQSGNTQLAAEAGGYNADEVEMLLDYNMVSNLEIVDYITEAE